jgi:hypothetical protein
MKNLLLFVFCCSLYYTHFSQSRPINKLTLETTYSYVEIKESLRSFIDKEDRPSYFDDVYFNNLLKKILQDKNYTDKEKVQLFYLMQKKLGFAFVGINYLPPQQNYFNFFKGEIITWQKTRASLKILNIDPSKFLAIADSAFSKDPILSSNALLLAMIVNADASYEKLVHYSKEETINKSKYPDIFNHMVCLCAGIKQDSVIENNLVHNVLHFKKESQIEDVLCALYAKPNSVVTIKDYILKEQNPENDLAIQTALCALGSIVPNATLKKGIKNFISETKEPWKKELLKNILNDKVPFNYSLAHPLQVVTKKWEGIVLSLYTDGALISNGALLEFDPN